ncbi:MAG TPA: LytR C-terminal domain-containing protein [Amycolatopsis sp.]|nr:LytR C-terminal domain-containing protein [Amycolatopsis sp.]
MNFLQGLSRPMRLAGVVLIAVAFVAVVIGTVTAVTGGNNEQTAAPSPSAAPAPGSTGPSGTSAPGPSSAAPTTTTTPPPESPTSATPPPATSGQPGATTGPDGGVPADQAAAKWVPVRVYNNSTIHGLAAKASDDFRAAGWNVVSTDNYPYGVIPTTTAYFTPGTDEETAAKALATAFGMKAEPRFDGIKNSSPGVIVIVTNDYQGLHAKGS